MPIIKRIEGATRNLGAPPDWNESDPIDPTKCHVLPIRDMMTDEGNFMVSAWEFTPAEIERLKAGETLKLGIRGTGHPVVFLAVGEL